MTIGNAVKALPVGCELVSRLTESAPQVGTSFHNALSLGVCSRTTSFECFPVEEVAFGGEVGVDEGMDRGKLLNGTFRLKLAGGIGGGEQSRESSLSTETCRAWLRAIAIALHAVSERLPLDVRSRERLSTAAAARPVKHPRQSRRWQHGPLVQRATHGDR